MRATLMWVQVVFIVVPLVLSVRVVVLGDRGLIVGLIVATCTFAVLGRVLELAAGPGVPAGPPVTADLSRTLAALLFGLMALELLERRELRRPR